MQLCRQLFRMYWGSTQVNMMITVCATSGSRGEQAMTLAIDVVKLASSMTIVRLIAEKMLDSSKR